jgi:predicted phosphodiesterase
VAVPAARILRRLRPALIAVLAGLAGGWLAMHAFGQDVVRMGPFEVRLESGFGRGQTVIALPPLGEIRLDTHAAPLGVRATLVDVDVDGLQAELESSPTSEIADAVFSDARSHAPRFALRLLGVATLGALGAGVLAFRRNWKHSAVATVTAVALVGGSMGFGWTTYRQEAFAEPTYEGTLELAPQLLGSAEELSERLDEFRVNLERIVVGASRAYTALDLQPVVGGDELRVLHISDVHLNTLGLDFAVQLARGFDVDLVVDTGDLTSFGTPLEEAIVDQMPRFGRPYVFVPGNHDHEALSERIEALPNGIVLDGEARSIEGLDIYGLRHPVFTEDQRQAVDHTEFVDRAQAAGERIIRDLRGLGRRVDVVAVHDDRMAEDLAGRVPLVISGHYHRARVRLVDGTLFMRAGSTGGAGVNMFEADPPVPFSATILHFERGDRPRLAAFDIIEQSPTTGRFQIERHLPPEPDPPD